MSVDFMSELEEVIDVTPRKPVLEDLPAADNELAEIKFSVADNQIAIASERYMALTINGVDDKEGYKLVHAAHMEVKGMRTDVEKTRKELKADALAWGKKVDGEAKRLKAGLEPIETHLKAEKDAVEAEKARILQEKVDGRIAKFSAVGAMSPPANIIGDWSDEDFESALAVATEHYELKKAEEARRLQAEADAKAEAERVRLEEEERQAEQRIQMAKERAELDAMREEQKEQNRVHQAEMTKLQAERDKLEAERQEAITRARLEEEAKQRADAVELATPTTVPVATDEQLAGRIQRTPPQDLMTFGQLVTADTEALLTVAGSLRILIGQVPAVSAVSEAKRSRIIQILVNAAALIQEAAN
jgi:hypothetical protein